MLEQRTMIQQVPLASIADTVVTLPEARSVPPGELHSQHVEQPGQSWDEWPTNSLWGALAGMQLCCISLCALCYMPCFGAHSILNTLQNASGTEN